MTVEQVLADEARSMGRPCELIESAVLKHDAGEVLVVLYETVIPAPGDDLELGDHVSRRVAIVPEPASAASASRSSISVHSFFRREDRA
jgi:hypothetical protein